MNKNTVQLSSEDLQIISLALTRGLVLSDRIAMETKAPFYGEWAESIKRAEKLLAEREIEAFRELIFTR